MTEIEHQVEALRYAPKIIRRKTRVIYEATLRESRYIRAGNFTTIADQDVERLFRLYDQEFFRGLFERLLSRDGEGKLTFRVSSQMTSAGGKTITREERRPRSKRGMRPVVSYELAVSALLLFQTFHEDDRPITVVGIPCADRLEALQRIVEHEMIHLLELLVWRTSSCSRERFQRLAGNLFGHAAVTHRLITPREIAGRDFGIHVGDRVTFPFEGLRYSGKVNRITKRATVLVEDAEGQLFSDGKRYKTFYVPLPLLERAGT